ncbi:MAG: fibronectin type III domain-containing protein [Clostridiaceae bacterium]|nr:fibronectin type III domain-containing protein [Clostridiaceae bacterium]
MYKNRKLIIRIIAWFLVIGMIAAYFISIALSAEQAIPSTPPQNVTVADIAYADSDGQNWYAEFSWGAPTFPDMATGDRTQTFFFNQVERGTGKLLSDVLQFTMGRTDTSLVTRNYGIELEHGMIYEFYGRSKYTYGELGENSFTSGRSNKVKFLTDVEFGAELISGTNEIRIVWDDVWDTDGRIDYRILISDTSGFTQPPSIPYILGSDIGTENSRVTVNGETLEYVYTNALPGREYSIKVIPLTNTDVASIPEDEIPVVRVKTEILLRAKKMGETGENVRWMLFWDPIIKGPIGSSIFTRVEYRLYRYDTLGNETFFALITDRDRYEMNLKQEDVVNYKYKIEAVAYKNDGGTVSFYSSAPVSLKEQIPEYPASPEFVSSFPKADPVPLVYDELVTDSSATLLWLVPETGEGKVDTDIYYDLYLVEDLRDINSLPVTKKIGSNLTMGRENEVRELESGRLIGYRYDIKQLNSNAVYYAVMVAKKNFLTESDDGSFMVTKPYVSKPAVKVIITRPDTDTDKPWAPPSPPFRLKPGSSATTTGFTLQMEKSWLEMFHPGLRKWLYVVREDDPEAGEDSGFYNENNSFSYEEYLHNLSLPDRDPDKKPERKAGYEAGSEISIHCVDYTEAVRVVKELKERDYIVYSDLKQSYLLSIQRPIPPIAVPNLEDHQVQAFDIPIDGLEPNKTYLIWITVKNRTGRVESEPSDPILVSTQPSRPPIVEIPVVPTDLKGIPADTYVDLFWSTRQGYSYNICYGTQDDRGQAKSSVTVTPSLLESQPWFRIAGLQADTIYYFWIQAISPSETGGTVLSDWSNSVMVKTEPYAKPPRPRGFGVKDTPDAVSETSVFYEWIPDETVTFILEISENADFTESVEYETDESEYQVMGLKSNYRYFARLYSYSSATGLRSEPTAVIMIVTRKGRGEYDADVPIDDIPLGDIIEVDAISTDGVWNAKVIGINAHRISEKIRRPGFGPLSIDLTSPPPNTETIRIELDGEVLETLSGVRKSLLVKTPGFEMIVLPGSFLGDTYFNLKRQLGEIAVRVEIRTPAHELVPEPRRQFALPVTQIQVLAGKDSFIPLSGFIRPLKVTVPVEGKDVENIQMRYFDTETGKWGDIENSWLAAEGKIASYPVKGGALAATRMKAENYSDIEGSVLDVLVRNIMSLYPMPSLPSGELKPEKELSVAEGMKHLLDIIPYDYTNEDIIRTAMRAGLLNPVNVKSAAEPLRRDEAIYAAVILLEKKTGMRIANHEHILIQDDDHGGIITEYRQACAFALVNGIIDAKERLNPEKTITRAEFLSIMEKVLMLAGELS